jgi:hypothetical protein
MDPNMNMTDPASGTPVIDITSPSFTFTVPASDYDYFVNDLGSAITQLTVTADVSSFAGPTSDYQCSGGPFYACNATEVVVSGQDEVVLVWNDIPAGGGIPVGSEFSMESYGWSADQTFDAVAATAAPEPSSLLLFGTGLLGLAFVAFRRAKASGLTF